MRRWVLALVLTTACQRPAAPSSDASAVPVVAPPADPVVSGVLARATVARATGNLTRAEAEVTVLLSRQGSAQAGAPRAWVQLFPPAAGNAPRRPAATGAPDERLNVAPGTYDVRIALREGDLSLEGWARGLVLREGESVQLDAQVVLAVGTLAVQPAPSGPLDVVVHATAPGRVDAQGALVTRRSARDAVSLPAGTYRVTLVDPETERALGEHDVTIREGEHAVIPGPAAPATGALTIRLKGVGGTDDPFDGATLTATDAAGRTLVLHEGSQDVPAGALTLRAEASPSKLVHGRVERSTQVPAGGAVTVDLTFPVAFGRVRVVSEPAVPGCRVSARTPTGLDEVDAGRWLAVPKGEVDLTVRCPDRDTRRFPGLVVEAGDRQTHTVRW